MSYDPREMETLRGFIEQEQLKVAKRKPRGKKGGFVGAIAKAAASAVVKAVPKVARTAIRQGVTTGRNVVKQLPKVFTPKIAPKIAPKVAPNKFQTLLDKVNPLSRSQQALKYAKNNALSGTLSIGLPLGMSAYQAVDYEQQKDKNSADLAAQSDEYYTLQDEANTAAIEKAEKETEAELKKIEEANKKAQKEIQDKYDADVAEKQKEVDKIAAENDAIMEEKQKKLDEAYAKEYAKFQAEEDERIARKLEETLRLIFAQQQPQKPITTVPITTKPVTTAPVTTAPVITSPTGRRRGRGKQLKGGFLLPLIGLAASLIPTIIEGVEGEKQRKQQDELNRQSEAAIAAQNAATEKLNREYARQEQAYRAEIAENQKNERDNKKAQDEYARQVAVQAENERKLALKMKQEEDQRIQSEITNRSAAISKQQSKKAITKKLAEARALQRQFQASKAREAIQQTVVPAAQRIVEVAKTTLRRGRGANSETINFIMDYYKISKKDATKIFKESFQE